MTVVTNRIAWAAGLFEGEGSIEVSLPPRPRTGVRLHLNTTDLDVLETFAAVCDCGTIRKVTAASQAKANWKTCWSWRIGRQDDCRRLLELWLPYLGARRAERACEALAMLDEKEVASWRTCYCGKHFQAKHGWKWACSAECRVEWQKQMHQEAVA